VINTRTHHCFSGLWVADLTVTQVLQEQVREDQRGIINGIQTSMNQLLDLVKFVLVVMIPETESFAFLIMASYIFVCMGSDDLLQHSIYWVVPASLFA
jgi:iron-regulated transporter 1